jgi:hypothetical protein
VNAERTQSVYEKWNISVVIATQIFNNGQPSHGGNRNIFEVMTSSLPKGTLTSVASLLAASSTKDILIGATSSDISYHLRDIYSIYIYAAGMLLHINGKFTMRKLKSSLCRKVPFLTANPCLFRGVGQDMKQIYLYLWYPLFQVQCDRCDQQNYSVKGHHLYRGT